MQRKKHVLCSSLICSLHTNWYYVQYTFNIDLKYILKKNEI